jgi:hypothetical protein
LLDQSAALRLSFDQSGMQQATAKIDPKSCSLFRRKLTYRELATLSISRQFLQQLS